MNSPWRQRGISSSGAAMGLAAAALGFSLLVQSPVEACSAAPCNGPGWILPESGTLPASAETLLWVASVPVLEPPALATTADLSFVDTTGGGEVVLELMLTAVSSDEYWVEPVEPLEEGHTYRLTGASFCDEPSLTTDPVVAEFTAGPSAAQPAGAPLGTLLLEPQLLGDLQIATWDGSCSQIVTAAQVAFSVELSAEAAPWAEVLLYETLVDGHAWSATETLEQPGPPPWDPPGPGESWQGRGRDLVFANCSPTGFAPEDGAGPGEHTIRMIATLPGHSGIVLESDEVTIDLDCGEQADAGAGGSGNAGSTERDILVQTGCGCRTAGGHWADGRLHVLWLGLVAFGGLRWRRRHRRELPRPRRKTATHRMT